VLLKQRLQPGRMFLVDTEEGRIISDEELKQTVARARPYRQWLRDHLVDFATLPAAPAEAPQGDHNVTLKRQQVFGYSFEDLRVNIGPMALTSIQPVGSMGTDTPLAVLSDKPQLLYNYFKQRSGARIGRAAGSAPLLPPARLWCAGHQPVYGL
jgi:glutamate synthase (ferredoxin)